MGGRTLETMLWYFLRSPVITRRLIGNYLRIGNWKVSIGVEESLSYQGKNRWAFIGALRV